jgi:hypothetical protein
MATMISVLRPSRKEKTKKIIKRSVDDRVWGRKNELAEVRLQQVLYYLSHTSIFFFLLVGYFSDRVSCFFPGPASDCNSSTYTSQ